MRSILMALLLTALVASLAPDARSQPEEGPAKAQERLEILQMWKMMEALDLDKKTADKIFEIRARFLADQKNLRQAVSQDTRKLRGLLKKPAGEASDKEIEDLLNRIRTTRGQLKDLWERQYDEVSKLLTIRQQARLILFFKDFYKSVAGFMRPPPPQHGMQPGAGQEMRPARPPRPPRPGDVGEDRPGPDDDWQ
ncbi:MAG: Spy/CpxP family protein refolding chaperone [Thermodesulfobacteriota bacterium]